MVLAMVNWQLHSEISLQVFKWWEDKGHVETITLHYNAPIALCSRVVDGESVLGSMKNPQVISHNELEYNVESNTQYLHNDTLCFRVFKVTVHKGNNHIFMLWRYGCLVYHVKRIYNTTNLKHILAYYPTITEISV